MVTGPLRIPLPSIAHVAGNCSQRAGGGRIVDSAVLGPWKAKEAVDPPINEDRRLLGKNPIQAVRFLFDGVVGGR